MIQLIVNVNLLRELDERKLINAYARYVYNTEDDTSDDVKIKENLIQILDWDKNGDNGLGLYCSKFESLKEKDWKVLIQFIKDNRHEIKHLSYTPLKEKRLEDIKIVNNLLEAKEQHNIKRFTDENYQVSGRGKKARPCIYEGKEYKSRQECMYKEGLTKYQIWKYLKETNQI
jgi:hypothetical protein